MTKYVSKEGKKLLQNTIQSLNSQNKIFEQNLMWKMNEKKRLAQNNDEFDYDDYKPKKKTKADHDCDHSDNLQPSSSNNSNNYWIKRLVKEEEKLPERWGHNGYRELYPDDFQSDQESSSEDSVDYKKMKRKSKSKKSKKKKSKKHKKHRRK